MKKPLISRRSVLRGAAGGVVALPLLEAMARNDVEAAEPAVTRRFLVWFTPNGTLTAYDKLPDEWAPRGTPESWTNAPLMSALEPVKTKLSYLQGMYLGSSGGGHLDGTAACLTGRPQIAGGETLGTGISVDQELARSLGRETPLRSLEVSAGRVTKNAWSRINYDQQATPIDAINSLTTAYARVFSAQPGSGGTVDTTALERVIFQRKSVLDAVKQHHQALARRLGGADIQKLDAHLTRVRELEAKLSTLSAQGNKALCATRLTADPSDYLKRVDALQDLLVYAFACDRTRVATFMWDIASSERDWTAYGGPSSHHYDFHYHQFDKIRVVWRIYAARFRSLLDKMSDPTLREGTATLLDNSLVWWTSEQSHGYHKRDNMPYILAGGAGGRVPMGRWLKYQGQPHNSLLVSILNVFGIPATTFGRSTAGALEGLLQA